ncbi:PEP/pyruvate-binding domain-containing protein [Kribbella endophytica]
MNDHITRAADRSGTAFAITPAAYGQFVRSARLGPVIAAEVRRFRHGRDLLAVGAAIRTAIAWAKFPDDLAQEILAAYAELGGDGTRVAVRNENTTGLPGTAWRSETFLDVRNGRDLLAAVKRCYGAAFSDLAIAYRDEHGMDQLLAAPTVGVRSMEVRVPSIHRIDVGRRVLRPVGSRRLVRIGDQASVVPVPEPVG